jgi:hypothetical protein
LLRATEPHCIVCDSTAANKGAAAHEYILQQKPCRTVPQVLVLISISLCSPCCLRLRYFLAHRYNAAKDKAKAIGEFASC